MSIYQRRHTVKALQIPVALTLLSKEVDAWGRRKQYDVKPKSYFVVEGSDFFVLPEDEFNKIYIPHEEDKTFTGTVFHIGIGEPDK